MSKVIFVAGLDNRKDEKTGKLLDLTTPQQSDSLKKGLGQSDITTFRYNANNSEIFKAIDDNPGAQVVLFSAGCAKSKEIANYLKTKGQDLSKLHINEPYTITDSTLTNVTNAIKLGVPASNVYSGGYVETGSNVPGATRLPGRTGHFESLTILGKYLSGKMPLGGTSSGVQQATPPSDQQISLIVPEPVKPPSSGNIVTIKKKSGPGELTGVTEQKVFVVEGYDVSDVNFNDLQFTEPGEYVLSITSDSPDVTPFELSVSVSSAPEIIAQERKDDQTPKENAKGTRPIIAKIDEPTLFVKPMEMPQNRLNSPAGQSVVTDGLGFTPVIEFNGYYPSTEDIKSLRLYHDGIVPKIDLVFKDSFNIMKENTPQDQSVIQLFLNSTSPNIKSIHLVFKIDNFEKPGDKPAQKYEITGSLFLPDLYIENNKSYEGTSFEVLRQICKELGLGFNSNIDNTDDKMKWRNTNLKPTQFIRNIMDHSYISDESYMGGYIDYYYCFNYVDINKEMKRDNRSDVVIDTETFGQISKKPDKERIVSLNLTNDMSFQNSSLFFSTFSTENNSTETSEDEGYRKRIKFYDKNEKTFLEFLVDSQTSDGKKSVILKGPQADTKLFDKNIKTVFLGKIDTENTHKNYAYAFVQNQMNLSTTKKLIAELILPNPNFSLYKLMKVNVNFINPASSASERLINYRDSGDYILWDINYSWDGRKMFQDLLLYRSELGKTPEEMSDTKQSPKKEAKQSNDNPEVPGSTASTITPNANSIYAPGEVYFAQDSNSKKFKITIQEVLDNGTQVKGILEEI